MPKELPPSFGIPQKVDSEASGQRKESERKVEFTADQAEFVASLLVEVCLQTEFGRPKSPLRHADSWARQALVEAKMYRTAPRVIELIQGLRTSLKDIAQTQAVADRFVRTHVVNGADITNEVQRRLKEIRINEDF
jgi:uncharacterized protein YukJ